VLVAVGGSSSPKRLTAAAATASGRKGRRTRTVSTRSILQRLTLSNTGAQPRATGEAAVVQQGDTLLLLLQGKGLAPNDHNYYAVWLYNSQVDNELLGLVSPAVGAAGTFSSGTTLPDDAVRFHSLVVTLETTDSPSAPGRKIFSSPLSVQ
jgi:hypothetical protein